MSIRYKLKSSAKFDTWCFDNGRRSISLRKLRDKILGRKADQRHQQGFALLFYDTVIVLEYKGDDSQIANGSSVIVNRIPSWTVPLIVSPLEAVESNEVKNSNTLNRTNGPTDKFGVDMRLVPDIELPELDLGFDACNYVDNEEDIAGVRLLTSSSSISESATSPALELKCPFCNSCFKDAVKIPCCHQSFCLKCIEVALIENGMCPIFFSTESNVESMLPNLSLCLATESDHVNEMLDAFLLQALEKYPLVAGEESSAQAKEFPPSSSAAGKGSNMESYYNQQRRRPTCGENQLGIVPRTYNHGEGGERSSSALGGYKKRLRTCYMCGSPDHIMSDCPVPYPNQMFQPGYEAFNRRAPSYVPSYWHASYAPYSYMYSNHPSATMMPFNAQRTISSFNVHSTNMRPPHHSNSFQIQRRENVCKRLDESIQRGKNRVSERSDMDSGNRPTRSSHNREYKKHHNMSGSDARVSPKRSRSYSESSIERKCSAARRRVLKEKDVCHDSGHSAKHMRGKNV